MDEQTRQVVEALGVPIQLPSPLQRLHSPTLLGQSRAEVWIKRDDLISPLFPGNKFRKLVPHLRKVITQRHQRVLTFGGAYSNHLYAFASAIQLLGLEGIACIRGERVEPLNPVLAYAWQCGVRLHFLDRATYRDRHSSALHRVLRQQFGDFYLIPEGGTDADAVTAVAQIAAEISTPFDEVFVAVGTGGTAAGLARGFADRTHVTGVVVLKGAEYLTKDVQALAGADNWMLDHDHHHGGYAKTTPKLWSFMETVEQESGIRFDPVYTAKALYALHDWLQSPANQNKKILFIHTGGLPLDTRSTLIKKDSQTREP